MNPEEMNLCYWYYYKRNNVYKTGHSYNIPYLRESSAHPFQGFFGSQKLGAH